MDKIAKFNVAEATATEVFEVWWREKLNLENFSSNGGNYHNFSIKLLTSFKQIGG